jgi:site-specific DNA-methyltransferase (adenine-specific)
MVSLKKITQEARRGVYEFVPMQDFKEVWTDKKLYKKYGLTKDEIAFIESMIRPMDLTSNDDTNE